MHDFGELRGVLWEENLSVHAGCAVSNKLIEDVVCEDPC